MACKIKLFLLKKKFYKAPLTIDSFLNGKAVKSPEYEFADAYHFPSEAIRTLIEKMRLEANNPEIEKEFNTLRTKEAFLARRNRIEQEKLNHK